MGVLTGNPHDLTDHLQSVQELEQTIRRDISHVAVVIPTYNAESHWARLTSSLLAAGIHPQDVLVIDSSSQDRTQELARHSGFRLVIIPQTEFNHGGTRQLACGYLGDVDAVIMMTQDAVLVNERSITLLLQALEDESVGAAYGRQLGREEGNAIEHHSRIFNYPAKSRVQTFESRNDLGVRAASLSNSFAIYRKKALDQVGGFPDGVLIAEDSYVAGRMLVAGWSVAYVADSTVIHSHDFTLMQEFRRYFDTGAHHVRERWLIDTFGSASGEGSRYVRSEFRHLLTQAPHLLPEAAVRTMSKIMAYWLGRHWHKLPTSLVKKLSTSPHFWDSNSR